MSADRRFIDRIPPRQQTDWDIRGALNFIFGGAGAGLLVATGLAAPLGLDLRPLVALGLALVGAGLFCVWLKIGRPWRALHVFRRPSTSWMTREAMLAPLLFICGAVVLLLQSTIAACVLGLLGLIYAYAQGRILKANIGIPAWRHGSCVAMIVVSAVTEGLGVLCIGALVWPQVAPFGWLLAVFIAARFVVWRKYRSDLRAAGAPTGALKALDALEKGFVAIGHYAAGALAIAGAVSAQPIVLACAGALALSAGVWFKHTLILRAAFTQGFSLPRTPSRGKGKSGAGIQPGWQAGQRQ